MTTLAAQGKERLGHTQARLRSSPAGWALRATRPPAVQAARPAGSCKARAPGPVMSPVGTCVTQGLFPTEPRWQGGAENARREAPPQAVPCARHPHRTRHRTPKSSVTVSPADPRGPRPARSSRQVLRVGLVNRRMTQTRQGDGGRSCLQAPALPTLPHATPLAQGSGQSRKLLRRVDASSAVSGHKFT